MSTRALRDSTDVGDALDRGAPVDNRCCMHDGPTMNFTWLDDFPALTTTGATA